MKTTMILAAAAVLTACTSGHPKTLVLYYSQTGATRAVAELIAGSTGADIEAFDVDQPYDGTFQETIQRCITERQDNILPFLKPISSDIDRYDVVFLGFPVWFGTCARPVFSLLENVSLDGKAVIPFCTFGSGGLDTSTADLKQLLPHSDVREGYGVRNARLAKAGDEIEKFLIKAGFKEGEVEVLPDFSETRDVSPEEAAIFNEACGSYEMPLGQPVEVASRPVQGGVEYNFTSEAVGMDGQPARMNIFVLAPEGGKPEFTVVIR